VTDRPMDVAAFADYFVALIRVRLDWDLITPETHSVRLSVVDSANDFSDWHFPWYQDASGNDTSLACPDAVPLKVAAIANRWEYLDASRREAIDGATRSILSMGPPARLVLATHTLPSGGRLVMDGNHRLAGLRRAAVDFVALEVALCGPIDPAVLPDLRFWMHA
jgi:hypothetical protein